MMILDVRRDNRLYLITRSHTIGLPCAKVRRYLACPTRYPRQKEEKLAADPDQVKPQTCYEYMIF